MSVQMKPIHTIEVDLGIQANGPMQQYATDTIYRYMYKYIPFSGDSQRIHLRENVDITEEKITFKTVYAKKQYYGSQTGTPWNYTTPGTGPYWDKEMLSAERGDILKEIAKKYGGNK